MIDFIPLLFINSIAVSDTFSRADNATSLGNAETRQPWVAVAGTWGIINGQAYSPVVAAPSRATIDSGLSNNRIKVTLPDATQARVIARYAANGDELYLYIPNLSPFYYRIYSRVAGTATLLSTSGVLAQNGDAIEIITIADNTKVFINSNLIFDIVSSTALATTRQGLSTTATSTLFDNFTVEVI